MRGSRLVNILEFHAWQITSHKSTSFYWSPIQPLLDLSSLLT